MSDQTENRSSDQPGADATTPPPDSTIPDSDTGVAVGYTGEPSTFEPEEDAPVEESGDDATDSDATDPGGTGQRFHEQEMEGDDLSVFQSHWDDFPGQSV
ncbi:hypothetical protein [Mycetocola miduiensis]|uniref:Uncharacterized protein n=1 Tax=Mycetocola miduiensis TaxID=995034 RepID=A0A1I4YCV5_9MICO|nr:hypothetical protein [Mycetocola miduiensis]SFN35409.1 hypothetical protein SAMN05216219_0097 [Mycetocola miduiensis]